jgi:hypothetical protein
VPSDEQYSSWLMLLIEGRCHAGRAGLPVLSWHSVTCPCPSCCLTDYAAERRYGLVDYGSLIAGH